MRRAGWPNWLRPGSGAAAVLIFRLVFGLLLLSGLLCFAMYIGTSEVMWRRRGLIIVKWTLLAAFGFFAVLILERLAVML
jgi:ABC-type nickel/cobalt efflux system permease component RcnA